MAPAPPWGPAKRVTAPLDDKVKALLRGDEHRLSGYLSSTNGGSHHDGCDLPGFLDGFFFSNEEEDEAMVDDGVVEAAGSDSDGDQPWLSRRPVPAMVRDLLKPGRRDRFGRDLAADVAEAVGSLQALRANPPAFRRAVMWRMRQSSYNAGICMSRWGSHAHVTAGSYEYIDVVVSQPEERATQRGRYAVDLGFAGEFEIARPTEDYERVAAELPRVFVGRPEELRRLLVLVADGARQSLRSWGMNVPPWRRGAYMLAKWLGPYRRTVEPAPPQSSSPAAATLLPCGGTCNGGALDSHRRRASWRRRRRPAPDKVGEP